MLIDDFITIEPKWPEKAGVMMYCLTIHWSSMRIQTAAFIPPHLYACERACERAQLGCLGWNRKTDESRYDVCPVFLLPLHHQASTAWVMMMRAARTAAAYYFAMVKDNELASYCAGESTQASNYCL